MKNKKMFSVLALLVVSAMILTACGGGGTGTSSGFVEGGSDFHTPTEAPTEPPTEAPTEAPAELGSMEAPIKMLFVPSTNVDVLVASGEPIAEALLEATGLHFVVSVPTSYAATVEEMCASPTDTIGFIPAMGYTLANKVCGVQPGLASVRRGWTVYWSQFIVRRDSGIESFADLEGKTWGFGDTGSTSGYIYPSALLADAGVTVGDLVETGGHFETAQAVYDGTVDFGTNYFSPPSIDDGEWAYGDNPDIPDELVSECAVNDEDQLRCGGYRVNDARSGIRATAPDVVQEVKILDLTLEIPNDTMSYSAEFPEALKASINDALIAYIASDACAATLCHEDHYDWSDAAPIFDETFDGFRILLEAQGITLENYGN